jgi:hypothetical protein
VAPLQTTGRLALLYPKPIALKSNWALTAEDLLWKRADRKDDIERTKERYPGREVILFWTEAHRPQDFVNKDIPLARRVEVANHLEQGRKLNQYRGFAGCRICGERLGTYDKGDGVYVWPEKAEHYVLEHDVWLPEFNEMVHQ